MSTKQVSSSIRFMAKPFNIGTWTLIRLPNNASVKLPSRGMAVVEGTLNDVHLQTALEPDGRGSHWFKVEDTMLKTANIKVGEVVSLEIKPVIEWPRPLVPNDFKNALSANLPARSLWSKITPNAQWEWIRWIRATKNMDTRKKRIAIACSKLRAGMRRPCCFNRNMCTETYVSDNGVLTFPKEADITDY